MTKGHSKLSTAMASFWVNSAYASESRKLLGDVLAPAGQEGSQLGTLNGTLRIQAKETAFRLSPMVREGEAKAVTAFAVFKASCVYRLSPVGMMNILPYFQKYLTAGFCIRIEFQHHEFPDACGFLKKTLKICHFLSIIHDITAYTKPRIMTGGIDPRIDMPAVSLPRNIQISLPPGSLRITPVKDLFLFFFVYHHVRNFP